MNTLTSRIERTGDAITAVHDATGDKTGSDVTMFLDGGAESLIAVRFDHKHHHVPQAGEFPSSGSRRTG
jgi:hypothetical protein